MARTLTTTQEEALRSSFDPMPVVQITHASTGTWTEVPIIGGRLTSDSSSYERSTLSVDVPLDLAPSSWDSLLTPDDAKAVVSFGVGIGPLVRCGLVWLDEVLIRRPDGIVTITGYSRATRVSQAGFPAGDRRYTGTCVQVAEKIVEDALGMPVTVRVEGGLAGPLVTAEQVFRTSDDPWMAVEDLMDTAGGEAFFDQDDVLVMRPVPRDEGTPVWTFSTGEGGTITGYDVSLRRAPNEVRMEFQNPSGDAADVVGVATAIGGAAPSGPYGHYRTTEQRTGVVTPLQANDAAADFLTRAGGLMKTTTFTAVPHPGVEVGDVIRVSYANAASETHRVQRVDLPLTPGEPMVVETRSRPWLV